jgi:hypothetical protein
MESCSFLIANYILIEECHILGYYTMWLLWVLTRATWRNIPEDGILQSYRHENLKSYIHIDSLFVQFNYIFMFIYFHLCSVGIILLHFASVHFIYFFINFVGLLLSIVRGFSSIKLFTFVCSVLL